MILLLNSLWDSIFWIFFSAARLIVGVFSYPIYRIISPIIPNLSGFMTEFNTFLTDYVFKGLAFAREVFLNVTCIPHSLYTVVVTLFFTLMVVGFAMQPALFVANSIRNVKKGVL